jgi:hypothetical protein
MANLANLDHQAHPASPANLHWKFAKKCHHHHANHAHQDPPAQEAHLAKLAYPDQTDHLDHLAKMDNPDPTDHPDPMDHLALLEKMVRKDQPAKTPFQCQPRPVTKDQMVNQARKDHLVSPVLLAPMVNQAQLDPKARPATLDQTETMVLPETKDPLDLMATRVNLVFVRNTARWTVASSSKMERDDKRFIDVNSIFFHYLRERKFFHDQHFSDIFSFKTQNFVTMFRLDSFSFFFHSSLIFFLVSIISSCRVHCDPD